MAKYDVILNSITPTEKVRRNVVLLSGLSFLLLHFAIETDGVTFLGARMPREVLYFAIFHALLFYVCALSFHFLLRGLDLMRRVNDAASERAEILAGLEDTDPRMQHRMQDLLERARSSLPLLRHERDHKQAEVNRLEAVLARMQPGETEYGLKESELAQARRNCAQLESRLEDESSVINGTANIKHKARAALIEEAKRTSRPPGLAIFYVLLGEWFLPLIFGVVCLSQLAASDTFTPFWQVAPTE